ncbi:heterokaryon incompatibility protein-domain-containing protein, partial [Phyllosticta capitalensis]
MEIFILPNTTSPFPSIGAAPEVPPTSSSKKSLEHAQKWLADCCKNHKHCARPTDRHHPLPKRLIDVLSSQEGGSVRLIETSSGQKGRYLCLSHCWGDPKHHPRPLETKKESLKRHKEQISWKSLPKTFQDAISFVRSLGESYIWIDSLCIVQDCPDDWNQEASKMADVYSNSYLTLAATKTTNSTESLFSKLDDEYKPHPYDFEENGSMYTLYFRKSFYHWTTDNEARPPPLLQRAWVYQERFLSPRTLHFGAQELLWECKKFATCECGTWTRTDYQKDLALLDKLESPEKSISWHTVVSEYSHLKLTKESDRLPAIAGVAKRIQCIQGRGSYLAGLWKESFLEDLLWRRKSELRLDDPTSSMRDTSASPSWSWICMKGTRLSYEDTF